MENAPRTDARAGFSPTPATINATLTPDLIALAESLARQKVQRLLKGGILTEHDVDDLTQDVLSQLVVQFRRYDPARGAPEALVIIVISTRITSWLRKHASRIDRFSVPLQDDGVLVTEDSAWMRRDDIERFVELLPPEDQQLCRELIDKPVAQVARKLNIPRTTLRERLGQIAQAMQRHNLNEYI